MSSVECQLSSAVCKVQRVMCRVWSEKCDGQSVESKGVECGV